jgi:hypothetical protein
MNDLAKQAIKVCENLNHVMIKSDGLSNHGQFEYFTCKKCNALCIVDNSPNAVTPYGGIACFHDCDLAREIFNGSK